MSQFNRKGYVSLPARTETGEIKYMPVKIGSSQHKQYLRNYKKWKKQRDQNNRNFKAMIKATKKMQRDNPIGPAAA